MALDYAPIILGPSKGLEFYNNPHNRRRQLAEAGVEVFESVNPIDDEEDDGDDDDSLNGMDLDEYMSMHCKKGVLSSPVSVIGCTSGCPNGESVEPPLKRTCSHTASGKGHSRGGKGNRATKSGASRASSAHSSSNVSVDLVVSRGPSIFGKSRKRCLHA